MFKAVWISALADNTSFSVKLKAACLPDVNSWGLGVQNMSGSVSTALFDTCTSQIGGVSWERVACGRVAASPAVPLGTCQADGRMRLHRAPDTQTAGCAPWALTPAVSESYLKRSSLNA